MIDVKLKNYRALIFLYLVLFSSCAEKEESLNKSPFLISSIFEGKIDKLNNFPSVVFIANQPKDAEGNKICSGTVISPYIVLTAAHCLEEGETKVVFTNSDKLNFNESNIVNVKKEMVYKGYNSVEHTGDIALLILEKRALLSESEIIPLISSSELDELESTNNLVFTISGFGKDENYNFNWDRRYKEMSFDDRDDSCMHHDREGQINLGRGANDGDSGGPAFVLSVNKLKQVGIAITKIDETTLLSDGELIKICGKSHYEKVDKFLDWIEQTSGYSPNRSHAEVTKIVLDKFEIIEND